MQSLLSVNDDQEACFRRGFQHGAQAAVLALDHPLWSERPAVHLQNWVDNAVAEWRIADADQRMEPPGPDGKPWPYMYPDDNNVERGSGGYDDRDQT